jgi:tRNA A37 threonylcarbamoyladenosine synthetase subunit TsaC/SUA5/YrdC
MNLTFISLPKTVYNAYACQFILLCDKNSHNTAVYGEIAKFKQQKNINTCYEAKSEPGKKSLTFLFEKINALKRQLQLMPEKTASSKKRLGRLNPSSLLKLMSQFNPN